MQSYIIIDGWKTNIRFSSAHIIPEYEKCGRLHGHTYAIHAKVVGTPDEKGIIIDFSVLKHILKTIAEELDHRILIPTDSGVSLVQKNKSVEITALGKHYVFPKDDCLLLPISSTSVENLANYVLERVVNELDSSLAFTSIEIGVDEGYGQGARMSKTW